MYQKYLGKIDFAEYGTMPDRPFMMGLQLGFYFNGMGIMDGGRYTVNISKDCRWEESERREAITCQQEILQKVLEDAKCNYVSELIGKPVEVTVEDNTFRNFRILTEVL